MAQIGFETPGSPDDILGTLNKTGHWRFTLALPDGSTYGYLPASHPVVMQNQVPNQYVLINGDLEEEAKPLFTAEDAHTMIAFLEGLFLGAFQAQSLETIQDTLLKRGVLFGEQDV